MLELDLWPMSFVGVNENVGGLQPTHGGESQGARVGMMGQAGSTSCSWVDAGEVWGAGFWCSWSTENPSQALVPAGVAVKKGQELVNIFCPVVISDAGLFNTYEHLLPEKARSLPGTHRWAASLSSTCPSPALAQPGSCFTHDFFFFALSRAAPAAYGGSQARG